MSVSITTRQFLNSGQQICAVELIGGSGITLCEESGLPHGIFGGPAGGESFDIPPLEFDFTEWEGVSISVTATVWGASGTYDWEACATFGVFSSPEYTIIVLADGVEYLSRHYDIESGVVFSSLGQLLIPAPFTVPAFHVDIAGDFHVFRASVVLTVRRWTPDTPPLDPPDDESEPPFEPQPTPLPNCGEARSTPPVIGEIVSGVVRT